MLDNQATMQKWANEAPNPGLSQSNMQASGYNQTAYNDVQTNGIYGGAPPPKAGNEWFGGTQNVMAQDQAFQNSLPVRANIERFKAQGMQGKPVRPQTQGSALPPITMGSEGQPIQPTSPYPLFGSKPRQGSIFSDSTGSMTVL